MTHLRRISPPKKDCSTNVTCPDVFELPNGTAAFIGTDHTTTLTPTLPPDMRIVVLPRNVVLASMRNILLNYAKTTARRKIAVVLHKFRITPRRRAISAGWTDHE